MRIAYESFKNLVIVPAYLLNFVNKGVSSYVREWKDLKIEEVDNREGTTEK